MIDDGASQSSIEPSHARNLDLAQQLLSSFTLLDQRNAAQAEQEFRQILADRSTLIEARYGLALVRLLYGSSDATQERPEDLLEQIAAQQRPPYPEVLFYSGLILLKAQRFGLAAKSLRAAARLLDNGPELLIALAHCEIETGGPAVAAAFARRALAAMPADANALFLLARALDCEGQLKEAAETYRRVLGIDKTYPEAGGRLADALYKMGETGEALSVGLSSIAIGPSRVLALSVVARCYRDQRQFAKAEQTFLSLVRQPEYMAQRNLLSRSITSEGRRFAEREAIVKSFWSEYSETLRDQAWFEQAIAECRTPLDLPTTPHQPETWSSGKGDPQVTLVSFSSMPQFRQTQERLSHSALAIGEIDHAVLWTMEDLRDTKFYRDHGALLDCTRGSGYWAWKPFVIYNELLRRGDGEYVIYYDCGRGEGYSFTRSIRDVVAWCGRSETGILPGTFMPKFGPNKYWTKRDCFFFMGCDSPRYWDSPLVMGSFSIWRNSAFAREFLREWTSFAVDPRIISDHPNICGLPNHDGFLDHRHDLSILTNLVVRRKLALPTYNSADINGLGVTLAARSGTG